MTTLGMNFSLKEELLGDPAGQISADTAKTVAAPVARPPKALLVEDDQINRVVMRDMGLADGHSLVAAHRGGKGVGAFKASSFEIILMPPTISRRRMPDQRALDRHSPMTQKPHAWACGFCAFSRL